jgi:hypothetical protein
MHCDNRKNARDFFAPQTMVQASDDLEERD